MNDVHQLVSMRACHPNLLPEKRDCDLQRRAYTNWMHLGMIFCVHPSVHTTTHIDTVVSVKKQKTVYWVESENKPMTMSKPQSY